jgi:hypothetical protein
MTTIALYIFIFPTSRSYSSNWIALGFLGTLANAINSNMQATEDFQTITGFLGTPTASTSTDDHHRDLISCLAAAQSRNIDFLSISWQSPLSSLEVGGTAEISQSLINSQIGFAFKRMISEHSYLHETSIFKALISEISILGHPLLRGHPNLLKLEGICWEIDSIKKAWPVLVFQKAQFGDLKQFILSEQGKGISTGVKLKLCADVATAIMTLHSCGEFISFLHSSRIEGYG